MHTSIHRVGFWSGILAALATLVYVVVQLLQMYRVLRFPWDELLIYGSSICIVLPFMLAMLALHHLAVGERRFWSHAALLLTLIYAVFVTANYVVQLATVIPATHRGERESVSLLVQSPHSMFWDYDAIGYIAMGLATLFAIPALEPVGFNKWVRYGFLAHGLVTPLIAIVYFYPQFSERLLLLGVPWGLTAPLAMFLLGFSFRNRDAYREKTPPAIPFPLNYDRL